MSLMRWFRRNNRKIMAIVIIVIMVGFVGGSYIQQLGRKRSGIYKAVAYYGEDNKITNMDIAQARQQLDILRIIGASSMLKGLEVPMLRTRDVKALLLNELLFPDRKESAGISQLIKQLASTQNYAISTEQINDIYKSPVQSEILWILLREEARQTGFQISNQQSGALLAKVVPQVIGATYQQLIGSMVSGAGRGGQGVSEDNILSAFADFIAVLEYSKAATSNENVTLAQLTQQLSWELETAMVESVSFPASVFVDQQPEPTADAVKEQFNKYKNNADGDISDENPYGFGYRFDDMVQVEYIAVKFDDVAKTVKPVAQEKVEDFYKLHREEFVEQVLSDPNDPNSPMTDRIKSFVEVSDLITDGLHKKAINGQAEIIIQDAKSITETALDDADVEVASLTDEEFKKLVGDYSVAAKQIAEKYSIKVYSGKTGLLTATDIRQDGNLGQLVIQTSNYSAVALNQIVFAIDQLQSSLLSTFDMEAPKMYQNIGPLKSMPQQMGELGKLIVLTRVVDASKNAVPDSLDMKVSKKTIVLSDESQETKEFVVKDEVVTDLKELAAMKAAQAQAQKFVDLAKKEDWEAASKSFNESLGKKNDDPNMFDISYGNNLRKLPDTIMDVHSIQKAGDPIASFVIRENKKLSKRRDMFFSLIGKDKDEAENMPAVMELKSGRAYLAVKSVKLNRLVNEAFEANKAYRVYMQDFIESQTLAPVFLNPENILKRMDYRRVIEDEISDPNETAKSGEKS